MKINILAICLLFTAVLTAQTEDAPVVPREDNIGYTATTDASYIYVTLTTEDHATMRSMLQRGFQVYFDKKGKKKKNVYVKYPKEMEKPERKERSDQQSTGDRGQQRPQRQEQEETTEEDGERRRPDFQKMVDQLPRVAEYQFFDTTEDVNLDINSQDIHIDYTYDTEADVLQYVLQIPINKVIETGTDISKLSIGIVSTEREKRERQGQGSSISMGGMNQRGGGGGGQRGGGGGGGQRGGGGQGGGGGGGQGGPPQQQTNQQDDGINFWFSLYSKD